MRPVHIALTTLALALAAPTASADPVRDVVAQLQAQGYQTIRVERTFLGRARIRAEAPGGHRREIILNPRTGELLRDYREQGRGAGGAAPMIREGPSADGRDRAARDRAREREDREEDRRDREADRREDARELEEDRRQDARERAEENRERREDREEDRRDDD
ncbi:hypothetical protein [Jannaschia sp. W003]|uniref:hypothetical protein n=1 Tax=Jannaschia sp. W003 TaxID=2867012 RepID=UPI0021A84F3F|nr:hypothetical protein [Jannaschia sp. W003]UWQ20870.1 hypothetical protein K3554_12960 [Jannaschia sp. W003]